MFSPPKEAPQALKTQLNPPRPIWSVRAGGWRNRPENQINLNLPLMHHWLEPGPLPGACLHMYMAASMLYCGSWAGANFSS